MQDNDQPDEQTVQEWMELFFDAGDWTPKNVILSAKAYKKLTGKPMNQRLHLAKKYQFGPPKVRKKCIKTGS